MGETKGSQQVSRETGHTIPPEVAAGFGNDDRGPKTARVDVRLSSNQHAALSYVAERLNVKPSEAIRIMAFNPDRLVTMMTHREWEAVKDYVAYRKAVNEYKAELSRLRMDINRIGTNVNQLTKRANEGKTVSRIDADRIARSFEPLRREVEETCRSLKAQCDRLLEAYEDLGPFEG